MSEARTPRLCLRRIEELQRFGLDAAAATRGRLGPHVTEAMRERQQLVTAPRRARAAASRDGDGSRRPDSGLGRSQAVSGPATLFSLAGLGRTGLTSGTGPPNCAAFLRSLRDSRRGDEGRSAAGRSGGPRGLLGGPRRMRTNRRVGPRYRILSRDARALKRALKHMWPTFPT